MSGESRDLAMLECERDALAAALETAKVCLREALSDYHWNEGNQYGAMARAVLSVDTSVILVARDTEKDAHIAELERQIASLTHAGSGGPGGRQTRFPPALSDDGASVMFSYEELWSLHEAMKVALSQLRRCSQEGDVATIRRTEGVLERVREILRSQGALYPMATPKWVSSTE
jgi:hypothetical protein